MSITYFLCRQCGAEWLGQGLSSDPFANMVNAVMVELCAKCQADDDGDREYRRRLADARSRYPTLTDADVMFARPEFEIIEEPEL